MTHFDKRTMMAAAVSVATAMAAWAIPAKRTPRQVSLPDGTTLTLTLVGDEHHHAYFTTDRYAVLPAEDGYYYYATLDTEGRAVRSAVRAHDEELRTAEEMTYADAQPHEAIARALDAERAANVERRMGDDRYRRVTPRQATRNEAGPNDPQRKPNVLNTNYPSLGEQKGIVILVQYTDVSFVADSATTYDYFYNLLNQEGFSDHGAHGSARDYFLASSMGQFDQSFDVYGPLTLSHNQAYYGGNDWYGNDLHPEEMVIEACQMLDDYVDFSQYDRDGDGEIDNVYIFYAGRGEASGGSASTVWPHSWDVRYAGHYIYLDGCILGHYACSNEIEGYGGQQNYDGIGTFTHEFAHVLGLPDIYATSYTNAFTPGSWDLLDYGSYNDNSRRPPYFTAYERYEMNWIEPTEIPAVPASYKLNPIAQNEAYLIPTEKGTEYFLLENRQQTEWDTNIPGHGMLIWHIDFNASVWLGNTVNNNANHQYVDIEEADNTRTENSRAGDAFPGTAHVTSFTDDTTPNMKSWSGHRQERPITNIREQDGIILFDVLGGAPLPSVTLDSISTIRPDGFTLHWTRSDLASDYLVSIYTLTTADGGQQELRYADGYRDLATGDVDSLVVSGLTPATDYMVSFAAYDGISAAGEESTATVRTADPTFEFLAPAILDATHVSTYSFTANWQPLDEATGYEISIYGKTLGEPDSLLEQHFDDNLNLGPAWSTNVSVTYAQAAYAGIAPPSIRFLSDGDYIETAQLGADIRYAEFWHRATSDPGENTVLAQVNVGGEWQTLASVAPHNVDGGETARFGLGEEIPIPAGARSFRLLYDRKDAARVAIDDIVIAYGGQVRTDSIPELTEVGVDATHYTADGLEAEHTYYYKVRARKGDLCSLWSEEASVTTTSVGSGIEEIPAAASLPAPQAGQIYDLQGRRLLGAPRSGAYIMDGHLRFAR